MSGAASWSAFWSELIARGPQLEVRLLEHLFQLTLVPVLIAALLSAPLALLAMRHAALRGLVLGAAGILQTIPSLAMLAFLLPLLGIGKKPAVAALTLYALLPILQNAIVGLRGVPASVKDAADGMGFTRFGRLVRVELPLAAPVILGGIRTATVICVGIATLSAFIGAGGLGDFINRGLALNRTSLLLIGAGAAALLALYLDFALETLSQALQPGRKPPRLRLRAAVLAGLTLAATSAVAIPRLFPDPDTGGDRGRISGDSGIVRVGTKNFTEQILLGEIIAQWIERSTDLAVRRVFNLGGTVLCHRALVRGDIDLYVEYTGTALTAVLGKKPPDARGREHVLDTVRAAYRERFDVDVLPPLGFDNTYAVTVRRADAVARGWNTVSDLAPVARGLAGAFTPEFVERPDGLKGLTRAYGLHFGDVRDLSAELMYDALARGEVDVIGAFATDGRIDAYDLAALRDDRGFFPPYQAVPAVRRAILARHPELRAVLTRLTGRLDDARMRRLNLAVDSGEKTVAEAARDFLDAAGLVGT